LEINQNKFLFKYQPFQQKITASFNNINPYILIKNQNIINHQTLLSELEIISQNNKQNFENNDLRKIQFENNQNQKIENINLIIQVKDINYEKIDNHIDKQLINSLKDIKLKKDLQSV